MLIHADDAILIATERLCAISKSRSLLSYCNRNSFIPQYKKCWFIVVNGTDGDRTPLNFGTKFITNKDHLELLGHLSQKIKKLKTVLISI